MNFALILLFFVISLIYKAIRAIIVFGFNLIKALIKAVFHIIKLIIGRVLLCVKNLGVLKTIEIFLLFIALYWLFNRLKKYKEKKYISWVEREGIGKNSEAPTNVIAWNRVTLIEDKSDFVIYNPFYSTVRDAFAQAMLVTSTDIQMIVSNILPTFRVERLSLLIKYSEKKSSLLKLNIPDKEEYYMAEGMLSTCNALFNSEGAATLEEFTEMCKDNPSFESIQVEFSLLTKAFLDHMVSSQKIDIVQLENGIQLYISKVQAPDSKMTRVELSLNG